MSANSMTNAWSFGEAETPRPFGLPNGPVCAALKNRGGFTGNYQDLVEYVRQFFDEAAYQLCDGFSVNTGYYSLHPRIGGTWANAAEPFDPAKHPVRFSFRTLKPLRDLAAHIEVLIEGVAETAGFIAEITDVGQKACAFCLQSLCYAQTLHNNFVEFCQRRNSELSGVAGQPFTIEGHKVKIAGENSDCGVYFVSATDATQRVKVTGHLADNTASRIVGIIPALAAGKWRVEVVTQYSGGTQTTLKAPRTLEGNTVLTVA